MPSHAFWWLVLSRHNIHDSSLTEPGSKVGLLPGISIYASLVVHTVKAPAQFSVAGHFECDKLYCIANSTMIWLFLKWTWFVTFASFLTCIYLSTCLSHKKQLQ